VTVEVLRREGTSRLTDTLAGAVSDEERLVALAQELASPLLEPATTVRGLTVRLSRLDVPGHQRTLFPETGSGRP
jgi:hypothetical protein